MVEFIPFELLVFVSAVALVLPVLAYIYRTSFPPSFVMWLGGMIWFLIFMTTNSISLGQLATNQTYNNVTDTIENTYECDCYAIRDPITFEPTLFGILFIMLSLTYIMIGVLSERGG